MDEAFDSIEKEVSKIESELESELREVVEKLK